MLGCVNIFGIHCTCFLFSNEYVRTYIHSCCVFTVTYHGYIVHLLMYVRRCHCSHITVYLWFVLFPGGLVHVSDVLMGSLASLTIKVGKKAFDIVSSSEVGV